MEISSLHTGARSLLCILPDHNRPSRQKNEDEALPPLAFWHGRQPVILYDTHDLDNKAAIRIDVLQGSLFSSAPLLYSPATGIRSYINMYITYSSIENNTWRKKDDDLSTYNIIFNLQLIRKLKKYCFRAGRSRR